MERHGNKAYLSPTEQRESGYKSPIDLTIFDLHSERSQADSEIDRIEELLASNEPLTGELHADLQQARARSAITRAIAKEVAIEAVAASIDNDLRNLTQ